jgi:predicted 3-demethylubiquinone-9 3-methyltransferase (glyoxalase superfamily)
MARISSPVAPLVPCVWLDDQAESAAAFYAKHFPHGRITATSRFPESMDNPSGKPRGSVLTIEVALAGQRFTLLNGGPLFRPNPSLSFFVRLDTVTEVEQLYAALADGGAALMPLDTYPWSERYGWVADRFGVSWQVIAGRRPRGGATIVPCLMFAGPQQGKAETAIRHYTDLFPGGRIDAVERYRAGEGPPGLVKHGRFFLAGQELVAMDSHVEHEHRFTEGLSLQVMCEDQAEIDRFWSGLGRGGSLGQCGWLTDAFGLSWQVGPRAMDQWMASGDVAARDRTFAALLEMKKLDLAKLQAAFEGRPPAARDGQKPRASAARRTRGGAPHSVGPSAGSAHRSTRGPLSRS